MGKQPRLEDVAKALNMNLVQLQEMLSCQTFKTLFLSSKTLTVMDSVKKFRCKTA